MTLPLQSPIRCSEMPAAGRLAPRTFDALHEHASNHTDSSPSQQTAIANEGSGFTDVVLLHFRRNQPKHGFQSLGDGRHRLRISPRHHSRGFLHRLVKAPLSLVTSHCTAPKPIHDRQAKALLIAGLGIQAVERQDIQPAKRRE